MLKHGKETPGHGEQRHRNPAAATAMAHKGSVELTETFQELRAESSTDGDAEPQQQQQQQKKQRETAQQQPAQPLHTLQAPKSTLHRSDSFNSALSSEFLDYLSLSQASRSAIQRTGSTRASRRSPKATRAAARAAAAAVAAPADEDDDADDADDGGASAARPVVTKKNDSQVSVRTLSEAPGQDLKASTVLADDTKAVLTQLDVLIARRGSKPSQGATRKESYNTAVAYNAIAIEEDIIDAELETLDTVFEDSIDEDEDGNSSATGSDFPRMSSHRSQSQDIESLTLDPDSGDLHDLLEALQYHREKLSKQSEANFLMERDLRQLDQRIGLLITHHKKVAKDKPPTKAEGEAEENKFKGLSARQVDAYGSMMGILKNTPKYSAKLARLLQPAEIDDFMRTVMFTLYGGDFDSRDEHMLLSVFEHALATEFAAVPELANVMRSNTAVSRMMSTYVRRGLGQQYLKDVLEQQIHAVMAEPEVQEIDLDKVKQELLKQKGGEPADVEEEAKQLVEERCGRLRDWTAGFLDAITSSLPIVPFGVRWLCKLIKTLTRSTYPQAKHENLMSLIGGFFLLRFVNPAIVSPDAYGLVKTHLPNAARRNLLVIAKVLQNMANSSAYTKDNVAKALNDFVTQNQPHLHAFLDSLTEADDFRDEFRIENLAALTKPATTLSITINELFLLHRLLYNHREELGLAHDEAMTSVLDSLGPAPDNISRQQSKTVKVPLFSLAHAEDEDTGVLEPDGSHGVSEEQTRSRVVAELERVQRALETLDGNYRFLKSKVDTYEAYLDNVRGQSTLKTNTLRTAFSTVDMLADQKKAKTLKRQLIDVSKMEPARIKLSKLDKLNIVLSTCDKLPAVGSPARKEVVVSFALLGSGNFEISVQSTSGNKEEYFRKACKFEEILEKTEDQDPVLELGSWMRLDAYATIELLDKTFGAGH